MSDGRSWCDDHDVMTQAKELVKGVAVDLEEKLDEEDAFGLMHDRVHTELAAHVMAEQASVVQQIPLESGYTVSETGMLKQTAGKLRMDVLPPEWKSLLARHMQFGAFEKKPVPYGADNWRKGGDAKLLVAAAERHILQYQLGEKTDSESGSSHLVAAACNLLMLAVNEGNK